MQKTGTVAALCLVLLLFAACTAKPSEETSLPAESGTTPIETMVDTGAAASSEQSLGRVTGVTAEPGDFSATVRWEEVPGADGYCIYKSADGSDFTPYKYSSHTGKSFSGLSNGVEYSFAVAAYKILDGREVFGEMSDAVTVTPVNARLSMSNSYLVLSSGEERQLSCRLYDEKQTALWSSSDETVVKVDDAGLLRAVGAGKAKITAALKDDDTQTTSCTVEVDRTCPAPETTLEPRYIKTEDGLWTNEGDGEKATLMFTGDLMATQAQMKAADKGDRFHYDFSPSFRFVGEQFEKADLVVGNLETTLCERFPYSHDLLRYKKISNCNTSPCYLNALRDVGFDLLTTANNHYCDAGLNGVTDTIRHLDDYRFMHVGTYLSRGDDRFVLLDVNGIKVAVINYNQKSTNGKDEMLSDKEQKDMLGKFYRSRVPEDIAAARERGAEWIIACIHFGSQNTVAVNETQEGIALYLADMGADLIIGTHPHLLQKFDYVTASDGRVVPCAYSLGNFSSSMAELDANQETVILRVDIEKKNGGIAVTDITYTPYLILPELDGEKYVITPTSLDSGLLPEEDREWLSSARESILETIGDKIKPCD